MFAENTERQSRGSDDCSSMADSAAVPHFNGNIDRLSNIFNTQKQFIENSRNGKNTSSSQSVKSNCMSIVRQNLENEGISDKASKIILSSWRSSTKKQYATYIKKWLNFYSQRHINSLKPSLSSVLDFLTDLFESGLTYSSINCARSALSAFGVMLKGVTVGCNATIIRFMKGVYNLRPTEVRYCKTWDVSKVLVFLRKLTPVRFLS